MLTYPITLERDDNSTILASFGPLGGYTYGRDRAEALHHAGDAIEVAIMGMMSLGDDIPAPSARIPTGAPTVTLGSQAECKIVIYRAMREAKVHKEKGLRSRIHRKGRRNKPLSEREKQGNKTRSSVRVRVEHVFGAQSNDMGGTLVRSVGLVRAKARIGLKNLACNMRRLVQLERLAAAV